AGIGKGVVAAGLLVFGRIGFGRELCWFGADADVLPIVRLIDRGYECRFIDLFPAADCTSEEPGQHHRQGDSYTHSVHLRYLDARNESKRMSLKWDFGMSPISDGQRGRVRAVVGTGSPGRITCALKESR